MNASTDPHNIGNGNDDSIAGRRTSLTVTVTVEILSRIPPPSARRRRERRSPFERDEHAAAYIEERDGRSRGLADGSLCLLSLKGGGGGFRAPVVLRVVDASGDAPSGDGGGGASRGDAADASSERRPRVRVNPCLAATLGLHWFRARRASDMAATLEVRPDPSRCVAEAARAAVREIGILPPSPRFRPSFDFDAGRGRGRGGTEGDVAARQRRADDDRDDEEAGLKRFFTHPPKCGKSSQLSRPKPRRRLLAPGSVFAACNETDSEDPRFYQVVDIQSSASRQEDADGTSWSAYFVSPSTHLTLVGSPSADDALLGRGIPGYSAWRLPRPSLAASFLRSIRDARERLPGADEGHTVGCATQAEGRRAKSGCASLDEFSIRHPSAGEVADALYLQGSSSASAKTSCRVCGKSNTVPLLHPRIVHVVGGEGNHVSDCVREASDIMGMRYFRVHGLAAFWAHCDFLQSYSARQPHNKSSGILTGLLPDKLNGLAAALKIAHRSCPCVLHVVGIDEELSPVAGHGADADGRREEDRRVLEVIREAMMEDLSQEPAATPSGSSKTTLRDVNFTSRSFAPRVIVVFSSTNPLPSGPIASSLEQSSIVLRGPDRNYARHLWDDNADETFDHVASMLTGLSAEDIVFVRQKFAARWKVENEENHSDGGSSANEKECNPLRKDAQSSKLHLIRSIMQQSLADLESINSLTQPSRSSGSSGTVPLSTTSLPNVRWEDIGGMESVREEIMDAVELPLKHPELFEGSKRSGILLFGPPGTGKTLVAKAVARECGLPFLSIKGPELLGSYVGESEANVRAVFEAARAAALSAVKPHSVDFGVENGCAAYSGASVLFFDELDSLAPRRGETGHGDGVMERVVATLLGELDSGTDGGGSKSNIKGNGRPPHVIVIGATNRPDLLDPSLLRPGRFDRLLYLGPAKTKEACLQILLAQTRKFTFAAGRDRSEVLREAMESFPPTLSGADLSAVASGALTRSLRRVCDKVEEEAKNINLRRGVDEDSDEAVDVNDVMESWTKEQLLPTVVAEDFIVAAKHIVPSISEQDLERFELLRNQFSVLS